MKTMNKKWRNGEKDDDDDDGDGVDEPQNEEEKTKNEGGSSRKIYMSRRSLFRCNRSRIDNIEIKRNELKKK